MKSWKVVVIGSGLILLFGCGAGIPTDPALSQSTVPPSVGAAIAAAFSGGGQNEDAGQSSPDGGPRSACSDFEDAGGGPEGILISPSVVPGTYGPSTASVVVTGLDDCEDDGANPLAFAAFDMLEEITATCDNGTTVTLLPGSAGVFRNDESQGHTPEVYGTFNIRDGDGNVVQGVRCAIILGTDEEILSAACEDSDGNVVDVSTSTVVCQFESGDTTAAQ